METPFFTIDTRLQALSEKVLNTVKESFARIENITEYNQQKVLSAFKHHKVSESHFAATTGYGYGDRGQPVGQLGGGCAGGAPMAAGTDPDHADPARARQPECVHPF